MAPRLLNTIEASSSTPATHAVPFTTSAAGAAALSPSPFADEEIISGLASSLTSATNQPSFDPATYLAAYSRTLEHGKIVLQARKQPRTGRAPLPPVWTPHREWLAEGLEYVSAAVARRKMRTGDTISENGLVVSLVLDRESGERGYLDGEVVVAELGDWQATGAAWERTQIRNGSVVVVVGRGWVGDRDGLGEELVPWPDGAGEKGFVVLENFRVVEVWEERRKGRSESVGMVKLQKAVLGEESWWMVGREGGERVMDMSERRFWGDEWDVEKRLKCTACGLGMPRMYKECWICVNSSCGKFWREGITEGRGTKGLTAAAIPDRLRWHKEFLMARTMFDQHMKPSWELKPDIVQALSPPWEPVEDYNVSALGTMRMRSLWRGGVCPGCNNIVPAIEWCVWRCQNQRCSERWRLRVDIGPMPLQAAVPRMFTSWLGHPNLEPEWPEELGCRVRRMYHPTFMVDVWEIVDNIPWPASLRVITPTAPFNQKPGGADEIWKVLLSDTRSVHESGRSSHHRSLAPKLVLNRSNQYPKLDGHFHCTFGAEYGFDNSGSNSDTKAVPLASASTSIWQAKNVLDHMCQEVMEGYDIDPSNSVQVHGYMDGMNLGWHTDGEQDIGNSVATLSVGGDAELVVRTKRDDEDMDYILGLADKEARANARVRIPLIHGSIVVMYGPFHHHFEHKVECKGPLRFAITTRHIKQLERAVLLEEMPPTKLSRRFNGQLFAESDDEEPPQPTRSARPSRPICRQPTLKRARVMGRSPSPPARRLRRTSPSQTQGPEEFKSAGWTQAQKDQIMRWHDGGMPYKQMAKEIERLWGEGKVKDSLLRMVVHREVKRQEYKRRVLGGDDNEDDIDRESSLAPSDSASAAAGAHGDASKWTQGEIDYLLARRHEDPPMPYKEISANMKKDIGKIRSDKACREQMTTLNRKKKGVARNRAKGQDPTAEVGTPVHGPTSPLAQQMATADNDEDAEMSEVEDAPAPLLEQAQRRASRAGRAVGGVGTPVVRPGGEARMSRSGRGNRAGAAGRQGSGETMEGITFGPIAVESPSTRMRTRSKG